MTRAATIHEFWFGPLDAAGRAAPDRMQRWFQVDEEFDRQLRARFEADLRNAASGRYGRWEEDPCGALTLILLFDQFPRNMYRRTPRAFVFDGHARVVLERALAAGHDRSWWPIERAFAYMPLEHAEDPELQARSVALFSELAEAADPAQRELFDSFLAYAESHREVIDRFGRFPHRNEILGRETTDAEAAWLAEHGGWG